MDSVNTVNVGKPFICCRLEFYGDRLLIVTFDRRVGETPSENIFYPYYIIVFAVFALYQFVRCQDEYVYAEIVQIILLCPIKAS